ncbi:hypothetical protein COMA2_300002 [Candidatus Nitrospira nitrificans]|uniref:Uncharacterized protein n=1 Tax=Candidatus Nitrospira nitrificans TaxID=1742973 RepID=A0A0S4LLS7_9BACT|nr:hypothetical protein COMA2_300002 [Candidatus Nitrospira nitrificans]
MSRQAAQSSEGKRPSATGRGVGAAQPSGPSAGVTRAHGSGVVLSGPTRGAAPGRGSAAGHDGGAKKSGQRAAATSRAGAWQGQ